jgi:phage shock protein PspC (stress-responsive transcriptional regulator)
MDKTININLGGILFQIDEEAFRVLRDYLQAINNRFVNLQGGNETIEDIETRISEIFQSQRGIAGVITLDNVQKMISIIGKPEEFDAGEPEPGMAAPHTKNKRMYRNPDDKIAGGVCSGIAAYLDTDPVIFRILFILFTFFFGVGFFIYAGLWIALPVARTESQKRELYGSYNASQNTSSHTTASRIANAFNEVFRAVGRVFYVFFRIFLIIIGTALVLTGFLTILSFVLLFVFKFPGIYSDGHGFNIVYIADFLKYMVQPSTVPWIIILTSIAIILPMLALIYWGVKMIFWFNARDGVVSLVALVIWVMSVAALSIIGFNEGVSFAKTAHNTVETILPSKPDTIYIHSGKKLSELKYNKEIGLPHEEYSIFLNEENKELSLRPYLHIDLAEDKSVKLEVNKSSSGKTVAEASEKTQQLLFNYSFKNDSLNMDEYYTLPSGRKWAGDNLELNLNIPEGTILKFDKSSGIPVRSFVHSSDGYGNEEYMYSSWKSEYGYWIMTNDGLKQYLKEASVNK